MNTLDVGTRNTAFVLHSLKTEHIPVVSRDLQGMHPRKRCLLPASGKAMVRRRAGSHAEALLAQDRAAAQRAAVPSVTGGGSVEPFQE